MAAATTTTTTTSSISGGNSPSTDSAAIKPDSLSVQLNLNLYNFDNPDAQFCPYVLTSPRSLEACSNLGVKPVELLPKPLTEFKKQIPQGTDADEVLRLYQEMEQNRIEKLEKCRYERKAMILSQKKIQRSLSASPLSQRKQENELHNREKAHTLDNRYSFDEALAEESDELSRDSHQSRTESFRSKRSRRRNDSWSAPTSPFRSVLMSSVVPITSPVLVSKLKDSPRFGLSLPSKDIKLMELMVHRHQSQIAEEEMKACARQIWAEELENFHRRQQAEERERWHRLTSLTTRDEVQERLLEVKNRIAVMQQQKRRELLDKEEKLRKTITEQHALKRQKSARSRERSEERKKIQEKRLEETQKQETEQAQAHLSEVQQHLEKAIKAKTQKEQKTTTKLKIQNQKDEEKRRLWKLESTHSSLCESEMQLEALSLKDKQVSERKQEITMQRQSSLKKRAETVEERQRQAKLNQSELDKALEKWRDKVSNYQKEANYRALQRASENIESRRAKVREERLAKEAEHRRNLERIRAEEEAKYLERLLKMVDREKQTEAFLQERDAAIEQSRLIAQAASDLREHLRQKLEEDVLRPPKALTASSFKTPGPPTPARRKCLKDLRKSKSFFC